MDLTQFKSDLKDSELIATPKNNVTALYNQYHSVVSDLVDCHTIRTGSSRLRNPWITSEALDAKWRKRQLEWVWHRTRSDCYRRRLNSQVHTCNRLMSKAKFDNYSKLVSDSKTNHKKVWNSLNRLLHK